MGLGLGLGVAAAPEPLALRPLLHLQRSIADCFKEAHEAYAHIPDVAAQIRKGATLCRQVGVGTETETETGSRVLKDSPSPAFASHVFTVCLPPSPLRALPPLPHRAPSLPPCTPPWYIQQLMESTKMLRTVEQTASAVLNMFPDLELAVEEGEPALAVAFFNMVRGWVVELRALVHSTQDVNKASMEQIQLIVEQSSLGLVQHRQRQQAEVVVETLTHRLADMLRVQRRTLQVPLAPI